MRLWVRPSVINSLHFEYIWFSWTSEYVLDTTKIVYILLYSSPSLRWPRSFFPYQFLRSKLKNAYTKLFLVKITFHSLAHSFFIFISFPSSTKSNDEWGPLKKFIRISNMIKKNRKLFPKYSIVFQICFFYMFVTNHSRDHP